MPGIENPENFQIVKVIIPKKLEQGTRLSNIFGRIQYNDIHGSHRVINAHVIKNHHLDDFVPYDDEGIREGKWIINSELLTQFINVADEVAVCVLNLGSLRLEKSQVLFNIETHPYVDGIYVELFDDYLIIENPEWTGWGNISIHKEP